MPVNVQAKLKTAAEKLDESLSGKGGAPFQKQLDNRRFLLKSAKLMDTEEGRSRELMEAARSTMQKSFDDYYTKLDKASKADAKVKRTAMRPLMKFGLDMQKVFDAYDKAAEKLVDDQAETKGKGKSVADAAAAAGDKKQLDNAIKDARDSRNKHLADSKDLLKKINNFKSMADTLHANAFKSLAQAEAAATSGDTAGAAGTAKLIEKFAKDAAKLHSDASKLYDKVLEPYFKDRNRLNAKATQERYGFSDKSKAVYSKELTKLAKTFTTAVNNGTTCINQRDAVGELAEEISGMAEQAKAFAKGGDELKQHVLNDLTKPKGKTTLATLYKNLDPMLKQAEAAKKSCDDLSKAIKRYNDGGQSEALKDAVDVYYTKVSGGKAAMEPLMKRAEATMKNAMKRVPKDLKNDKQIKESLKRMGELTVRAKSKYNAAKKQFDAADQAYAGV